MRISTYIVLCTLLLSCGNARRVGDTGLLQKRKYLPGWDLALFSNDPKRSSSRNSDVHHIEPIVTASADHTRDLRSNKESGHDVPVTIERSIDTHLPSSYRPIGSNDTLLELVQELPETEVSQHKKPVNLLAPVVFLTAIAAIGIGLTSTNTLAVIVLLGITFILAAISIKRIRKHDMGGKGFAIIGLTLAALTSVATAIAIVTAGGL